MQCLGGVLKYQNLIGWEQYPIRIILKPCISGVQWIDHDQIGLSAYGRDYVITEKIG